MSTRECPACGMETDAEADACAICGYEFPVQRRGTRASAWLFVALMVLFAVPLLAWLLGWLA
ncbi:MAG: zinc ribbon domain-containing protein [Bacteroidota bacterium]